MHNGFELAQIRVRPNTLSLQDGYSVLATNLAGEMDGELDHGLFERNTRYISRYCWQINHMPLGVVAVQPSSPFSMFGYYTYQDPEPLPPNTPLPENALDIQIARIVGQGMHEDLSITNHSQQELRFGLSLVVEVDFADINEVEQHQRQQLGTMNHKWDSEEKTLEFHYHVRDIHHGMRIRFNSGPSSRYQDGTVHWTIDIEPKGIVELCIDCIPIFCDQMLPPLYQCKALANLDNPRIRAKNRWIESATRLETSNTVVKRAFDTAKRDLAWLRLSEEDQGEDAWIPAAGLPVYLGVFGRDVLTSGWQAGLFGPEMMRGAIAVLDKYQAKGMNDWRDEQPGKMIHEVRLGPLSLLDMIPYRLYYGSTTSTPLYFVVLSELFHWTGDIRLLEQNREPMMKALEWIDRYGDLDSDGFYEYQSLSTQGNRNQGWKDSQEGILYEDGGMVPTPIATCEEQAWVYEAKVRASIMFAYLKEYKQAEKLIQQAHVLKEQFNKAFWMPEENFFALALDPNKRQVKSITSNPGHCLVSGIVHEHLAGPTIGRMITSDLFSGWGIRTLSDRHPAYNPHAYHLGSVWPVENGTFCLAFIRYGFPQHTNLLAEAIFSASSYFEQGRLPEAFSGHPRDEFHPFPSVYPNSCWPQAWSSSAIPITIQAILGLYPFAPLNLLFLDPHLPEWLPEVSLYNLRVGDSVVSLSFWRDTDGKTHYRPLEKHGHLKIMPHQVNIHAFHKLKDFSEGLLAR